MARTEVRHAAREFHFRQTIRQFPPQLQNSISSGLTTSASGTARSPPRTRPAPSTSTSAPSPATSSSRPGDGDRSVDVKIFFVEYQIFFALVAAVSCPPAGPLRGLRPSLRRLPRGLHTRPLLMSRYSEYIFKDSRVAGGLSNHYCSASAICSITSTRILIFSGDS